MLSTGSKGDQPLNLVNLLKMKQLILIASIFLFCLASLTESCKKDDQSKQKVECSGGCTEMSWGVSGESGSVTISMSCSRTYTGSSYIETCTGTKTYSNTGHTYAFTATYDWPACKINVQVTGVGSCSD
jgi:hypothetical protein